MGHPGRWTACHPPWHHGVRHVSNPRSQPEKKEAQSGKATTEENYPHEPEATSQASEESYTGNCKTYRLRAASAQRESTACTYEDLA